MVFNEVCPLFSELTLNSLRLQVHLGCTPEERRDLQYVRFDVQIRFESAPVGCQSDFLGDTVCYAELNEILRAVCQRKEYQLIEKLGWEAFISIKEILPRSARLRVRVTKEKPPIFDPNEGASFCLGEWNE